MKRAVFLVITATAIVFSAPTASGQQYTGTSGLIHTPSAEMKPGGTAVIGGHFINKNSLPGNWPTYKGNLYHTFDYYLGIALFDWVELSYTCTEKKNSGDGDWGGFGQKDRYFSVKFRPLGEGKWWPAIALGMNDIYTGAPSVTVESGGQYFFGNAYVSLTKNFHLGRQVIGVTASYRRYIQEANFKWNGIVGGVFWRPSFLPQMRLIAEYSGAGVNFGIDALVWKFLLLQVSVCDCKYINGGICLQPYLHPKKKEKRNNK